MLCIRETGDTKRRSGGKKEKSMSIKHQLSDERIDTDFTQIGKSKRAGDMWRASKIGQTDKKCRR